MLVVADTTPIISLLKINRLDLLEKLFKTIKIPKAVLQELTSNPQFSKEAEAGRTVASKIGLTIIGTIGILIAASKQNLISSEEIKKAAETFRKTGRFLSETLYKQLLDLKK